MRILILGGDGMLGHQLLQAWQDRHEVMVSLRGPLSHYAAYGLFSEANSIDHVDVRDIDRVGRLLRQFRPEAVVNAVGIIKQRDEAHDAIACIEINTLLPHRLSVLCTDIGARLVHLSTDCVFSGKKGMYREDELEDARDLYGRSKLLGEVHDAHAVTLRTSIIGLELARKRSLIEWFLAQRGTVKGFTRAIYSGLTTLEMARIIERVLLQHPDLSGLWHVASQPISKYDLLQKLAVLLGRQDIDVVPYDDFACDRSLDASRFEARTGYQSPSWDTMLADLAAQIQERAS